MVDLTHIKGVLARRDFSSFAKWVMPNLELTDFHNQYYSVLGAFAQGDIKRLIVSVPPQHGKSLGASQLLPAFILGLNPDAKICIGSYAFSLASKFSRRVQRLIKEDRYKCLFPQTQLKSESGDKNAINYIQTAEEFEIVGYTGGLRAAGREGAITGNTVDIMILDDLYKDAMEANSPLVRDNTWEFYTSVIKTRLHNTSQELIVFTRWHEDDLIGRLKQAEKVVELNSPDQLQNGDKDIWYLLNFEAIKESEATQLDPRSNGEVLWPSRHGLKLLTDKRNLDRQKFDCMYQGNPSTKEGLLYGDTFAVYDQMPVDTIKKASYIDTADTGTDCLCAICYQVSSAGNILITDVLYTTEPMEVTESATASMLLRNKIRTAYVESNNGGRGFARTLQKLVPNCKVQWFHQSGNKESRILTNSATVLSKIIMPADWRLRWPGFYGDLTTYKRLRANKHDDAPDVLTGIVEKEIFQQSNQIKHISFTN